MRLYETACVPLSAFSQCSMVSGVLMSATSTLPLAYATVENMVITE